MQKEFPLEYSLEDGTTVVVNKNGNHVYDFTLKTTEGSVSQFTINDDEEFTEEKEKALDFDQLNALRRFWLETRNSE